MGHTVDARFCEEQYYYMGYWQRQLCLAEIAECCKTGDGKLLELSIAVTYIKRGINSK